MESLDREVQQLGDETAEHLEPGPTSLMNTIQCVYCGTQLSYPQNSVYIQCPKCTNTMNPQAPHTNYMNCIGCNTLLSHPPSSLTIQCPKCLVIMELPVRGVVPQQTQAPLSAVGGDPEESRKSRKKRKDPHAPKRASNAYMIFCKERRARLKEERPDLPFGKLGAKLGELWRTLSPEEKKPYENRASSDRERYKKEMASYQASGAGKSDELVETKVPPTSKKLKTLADPADPTLDSHAFGSPTLTSTGISSQHVPFSGLPSMQLGSLPSRLPNLNLLDPMSAITQPPLPPQPRPISNFSQFGGGLEPAKTQEAELQAAQQQLAHHQARFQASLRQQLHSTLAPSHLPLKKLEEDVSTLSTSSTTSTSTSSLLPFALSSSSSSSSSSPSLLPIPSPTLEDSSKIKDENLVK